MKEINSIDASLGRINNQLFIYFHLYSKPCATTIKNSAQKIKAVLVTLSESGDNKIHRLLNKNANMLEVGAEKEDWTKVAKAVAALDRHLNSLEKLLK